MEVVGLGREYDTLRSRKQAGEGVSSDAMKGTGADGTASYSSIFVFVVVLCRGYSCVRDAGAGLEVATSASLGAVDDTYRGDVFYISQS